MPIANVTKWSFCLLTSVILGALIWWNARLISEIKSLNGQLILQRRQSEAAIVKERANLKSLVAQQSADQLPKSEKFEDALDVWLGKVRKLDTYLQKHPEKRIPQMDLLTASDWLDVTKKGPFSTDADYRRALGELRGLAREKIATPLGKALAAAIASNAGNLPSDTEVVANYLPSGTDPSVALQLQLNPSGKIDGLNSDQKFVVVDKAVDDLWDATLFYNANGDWGMKSSTAPGEHFVNNAIADFTKNHGVPPTSPDQLKGYPGVTGISDAKLMALFQALTNKVDVP